ncbi:MAG: replicative DNA helicase [Lachnospiraceae bacterium]|nr:replicative DNA helicase [Lachnospiraceae bacterium]
MDEALIKRVMPHSTEAEQSVIGSMLLDREAIMTVAQMLSREDFYNPMYGLLYEIISELFNEGKPADILTVQNRLKEKDAPPEAYELKFFNELISSVPTSANVRFYAEIVKNEAIKRRTIKVTEAIANDCYMGKKGTEEILEDTEKQIFELVQRRGGGDTEDIRSIVLKAIENIENAAKNRGAVTGIATGFYDLDYKTAGLQRADLILVAARPSMGKTAFVLNIAEFVALKSKVTTAIFSLEMSRTQLVNRILAMNSKVDSQAIRTGDLKDDDWVKLMESARLTGESPLIIDDTPGISIAELRSKCRKFKLEKNLGLVIIDYLQLMSGGKKSESRQQEISEISRSLKALAREIDCPVIALSQLSRAVEQREDKRPMLSDLRESGAIEQDADVVMFIYRDEYYTKEKCEEPGVSEIIIGKQRNGPTGTVKLAWLANYTKFANLDNRKQQ